MTSLATWKHRATLYVEGGSTAEATVDATPRKIAAFTTKGPEVGVTSSTTTDNVTVAEAGDYFVSANVSFSGTLSSTYNVTVYIDTTSTNLTLERKLGTGGDVGSAGLSGLVTCAAGEAISLYQSTADGSAMTVTDAQLTVIRMS